MTTNGSGANRLLSPAALAAALRGVRALAFDFDGVFTDNRVWVSDDGRESVACCRSDGLGLARVRALGLPMSILSAETNPVVRHRARKLNIPCVHGLEDKVTALRDLAASHGMTTADVAFVGNDINDIGCLEVAGLAVVPADAHACVRRVAHLVLETRGGFGAVREFCDRVADARV